MNLTRDVYIELQRTTALARDTRVCPDIITTSLAHDTRVCPDLRDPSIWKYIILSLLILQLSLN